MPIDRIPILAEDYPLFDWNDHLLSYYALGEGELVSGFQKETWNSIINHTQAALKAAGMTWDSKYTTLAGAKVTEAYGPLSAKMFNSVRHNIDRPASVGWGWAYNPALRGYIGREDFKGYAEHGLNGDLFYAEYLLELVRRLNLMISIMRGTANLKEMDAPTLSLTGSVHILLSLPSAPMKFSQPAFSSFICGLQANQSKSLAFFDKSFTRDKVTAHRFCSRPLYSDELVHSKQASQMAMPTARIIPSYKEPIFSLSEAEMDVFNAIYLSSGFGMAKSSSKTIISLQRPSPGRSEEMSKAIISATSVSLSPQPVAATETAKSKSGATITSPMVMPTHGAELVKTTAETVFETIRPRRLGTQTIAGAKCIAILDSAWFTPIWVNGKLYIRQAHEAIQTDATLEVR